MTTIHDLTDEQFYGYLQEKYGDNWRLTTLTPEEFGRLPRLTPEEIDELLKQGHKERLEAEKSMLPPYIPTHIFFR